MFEPGSSIGSYKVVNELGKGGMGTVYLVRDKDERDYAIKIANPEAPRTIQQRFAQEVKVTKRLQDMHLVYAFESSVYRDGDVEAPYLVLQYLVGGTLEEDVSTLMKRGESMPVRDVVRIAREVAAGLTRAHAKQIIHRDLKPSNIFLHRSDVSRVAMIIDFGLALIQRETVVESTAPLLSPPYAPPEQWTRWEQANAASDIYSFGATLYEVLAGEPPFGFGGDLEKAHRETPVPSLAAARKKTTGLRVPKKLARVVEQMLAKDPAKRPTLPEVVTKLKEIEQQLAPWPFLQSKLFPWLLIGGGSAALVAVGIAALWPDGSEAHHGRDGGNRQIPPEAGIDAPRPQPVAEPPAPSVAGAVYVLGAAPGTQLGVPKPADAGNPDDVDVRWKLHTYLAPTDGYWISKYPVTNHDAGRDGTPELPVQGLNRDEALRVCETMIPDRKGALPTEAEWEWAARSGIDDKSQVAAASTYKLGADGIWHRTSPSRLLSHSETSDLVHTRFGDLAAMFTGVEEWTADTWTDANGDVEAGSDGKHAVVTRGFPLLSDVDPSESSIAASGAVHRTRLRPDLPASKLRMMSIGFRCVWR